MLEGPPTDLTVSDIIGDRVSHSETVLGFASGLASTGQLDIVTSEALQKYATITYLARSIRGDFENPDRVLMLYPFPRRDDGGNLTMTTLCVTRETLDELMEQVCRTASGIYDRDLKSDGARAAAGQVQEFIDGILR